MSGSGSKEGNFRTWAAGARRRLAKMPIKGQVFCYFPPKSAQNLGNCTHYSGRAVGIWMGCGVGEGAVGCALSNGVVSRVRAVPGAELWDL